MYGTLFLINCAFGILDDYWFIKTIRKGKFVPFFISPHSGRFYPLDGQEYNIVSLISISPTALYIYNLIQFLITVFISNKVLKIIIGKNNKNLRYLIILFIIFTPAFTISWFRFLVPERSEFFFLLLFIYCFLLFQKSHKIVYLIIGLLTANIAIYYKEPGFLILGSFAFFHLLFGWKKLNFKQKIFDYLLLISSLIFVICYYFIVYINKGDVLYGQISHQVYGLLAIYSKSLINLALNNPTIFFLLIPLFFYRTLTLITKKVKLDPIYDSMLIAGIVGILPFFILKMYIANHYILPIYTFGIFGIVYFCKNSKYYKNVFFRVLLFFANFISILSSIPTGIHLISFYKNTPFGYQKTITFLSNYINTNYVDKKIDIFFDSASRITNSEIFDSFNYYLIDQGVSIKKYDIKSTKFEKYLNNFNYKSNLTVNKDNKAREIMKGNLLIITPYTYNNINEKYIKNIELEYKLLFKYEPKFDIGHYSLKSFLKLLLNNNKVIQIGNKNYLNYSIFYIYIKISCINFLRFILFQLNTLYLQFLYKFLIKSFTRKEYTFGVEIYVYKIKK